VHRKFCTSSSVFSSVLSHNHDPTANRPTERPTERTNDRPTDRPSVRPSTAPVANHHHHRTRSPSSFARSLYADIHCHSSARSRCFPAFPRSWLVFRSRSSTFSSIPSPFSCTISESEKSEREREREPKEIVYTRKIVLNPFQTTYRRYVNYMKF